MITIYVTLSSGEEAPKNKNSWTINLSQDFTQKRLNILETEEKKLMKLENIL